MIKKYLSILMMMELFVTEWCPYCVKVKDEIKKLNIENQVTIVDAKDNMDRLIKLGGKRQVPFLVDGNTKMYESNDIINYLKTKKK